MLASKSSAVPPVCRANAEFSGMPDGGLAEAPVELVLVEEPLDEELVEVPDELEVADVLDAADEGAVGVKVELLLPKPSADA